MYGCAAKPYGILKVKKALCPLITECPGLVDYVCVCVCYIKFLFHKLFFCIFLSRT